MTRKWTGGLALATLLLASWATTSEACHRRRAVATTAYVCQNQGYATRGYAAPQGYAAMGYASPTGYSGGAYAPAGGGYHNGRDPGGGYDPGRPGYNPGGLGGPASGLGVRPGLGFGGFGPGR